MPANCVSRSCYRPPSLSRLWISAAIFALAMTALSQGGEAIAQPPRALVLSTSVFLGSSSEEVTYLTSLGFQVDLAPSNVAWPTTAAGFAPYRVIVIGDPQCAITDLSLPEGNASVWGPLVDGNIIIIGTDPANHAFYGVPGAQALIQRGLDFASAVPGKLGFYCCLSCKYHFAPPGTPVPVLDGLVSGSPFRVRASDCANSIHVTATDPLLVSVTDATLSNWQCSTHEVFETWPSSFLPFAIGTDVPGAAWTAPDGIIGQPHILARG